MLEDTPASTLPVWLEFSANSFQLSHLGGLKVSNDFHPVEIHVIYLFQSVEGRDCGSSLQ
jgi:hypothetical protein